MTTPTETPRTDACPHCGAKPWDSGDTGYKCGSDFIQDDTDFPILYRSSFCYGNENSQLKQKLEKAEAEVERLRELMSRFCESVAENWDEGIADYFMEEMNKTYNEIHPQHT